MAAALAGLMGDPLFWRTNAAFGMPQKGLAVLVGWDGWLTELPKVAAALLVRGGAVISAECRTPSTACRATEPSPEHTTIYVSKIAVSSSYIFFANGAF